MAYIAYKPRVNTAHIDNREYYIEEKWYIVKNGYDTEYELAVRFEDVLDIPSNHIIIKIA